ncbi:MAG: trypsin-like serine peptidase [Oligoflexus sp.]
MKRLLITVSCVLFSMDQTTALAFPEFGKTLEPAPESALFNNTYDFEGILGLSGCSGSLVRYDDSKEEDKALVLTNGHCVKMINPGVVIVNESSSRSFDILNRSGSKIGTLRAESLLYATMTKTDLALYRLRETYQQIRNRYNTEALTLARDYPAVGMPIEIISGYWKRGYNCEVESYATVLKEGNWFFEDSIRYSRPGCEVIGGTSGSPVIAAGSRTVVAVNNTINERGARCTVNNPCEIDEAGEVVYQKGFGYAQQTAWVYTCRLDNGDLDLNLEGCLLAKPQGIFSLTH